MNAAEPQRDPVPPLAREVIALFSEALPSVRFPDLDVALLEGMTEELLSAQVEAERLEAELETARNRVQMQVDLLSSRAQRALSYARVFAEGNAELSARVAEVREHEPSARREPAPTKKRGRQRKNEAGQDLFDEPSQTEAELSEHAA